MKKFILSVGLLVTASVSLAGPRVIGNGGDAVVCIDSSGNKKVEILDYYEARVMRNINIDLGSPSVEIEDKIALALTRLNRVAPWRAQKYRQSVIDFFKRSMIVHDSALQDIPDSQHVVIPQNCSVQQLVVQRQNAPADEPKFIVNGDIWDLMDNTQRAGIILHEVIYQDLLEDGAENSIGTRYFNSKISSGTLSFKTPAEHFEFFDKVGFKNVDINGMLIGRARFFDNGQFAQVALVKPFVFTVGKYKLTSKSADYHKNGTVQHLKAQEEFVAFQGKTVRLETQIWANMGFYDDGSVEFIHPASPMELRVQGKKIVCSNSGSVLFHPNGGLEGCFVEESFSGKSTGGSRASCSQFFGGPFSIPFTPQGLIDLESDKMENCKKTLF
jgi:hypothetical protein